MSTGSSTGIDPRTRRSARLPAVGPPSTPGAPAAGLRLLGWDDGPLRLLLPADCVLEVIAARSVRPVPAGPAWLRGWAEWRRLTLPLVTPRPGPVGDPDVGLEPSAAPAPDGRPDRPARGGRWLVCIGPAERQGVDLFALHAASHPRIEVLQASALIDALIEPLPEPRPEPRPEPPVAGLGDARVGAGAGSGGAEQGGAVPWLRPVTWRGSAALVPDLAALQAALVALLR